MKKLQFVFIVFLLLHFTGCKSVVKDTVIKKPVVEKSESGVFFHKKVNGVWRWVKNGNEKTDSKYVGEIRNGIPNGQGTHTTPKGNKYEGEWKDGFFNGQGTFTWSNGNKYLGGWKGGLYNGQGTETFSNGNKLVGVFENGNPWNIIKYDKNGNIKILASEINGVPLGFTDDVDVGPDNMIYFTEASEKFSVLNYPTSMSASRADLWEHRPYGKIIRYNPFTKESTLLLYHSKTRASS